jgi:RPA family protein
MKCENVSGTRRSLVSKSAVGNPLGSSVIFAGGGFSDDTEFAKSDRLQPLKYGFGVSATFSRPTV